MSELTRRQVGAAIATSVMAIAAEAQVAGSAQPAPTSDSFLLTVFLRHHESKTLNEINAHLRQTGYYKRFPPEGVKFVTWYVMMAVGQVVTLRVPPAQLREVNRVLEETA